MQGFYTDSLLPLQSIADALARDGLASLASNTGTSHLEASGILRLMNVADNLESQIAMMNARLREHISELHAQLKKEFGGTEDLTFAYIRLQASNVSPHL